MQLANSCRNYLLVPLNWIHHSEIYNDRKSIQDVQVHQSEALWARQERVAVYDNNTGQLHVQLSCGGYVITGHPPLSVEWTVSVNLVDGWILGWMDK